VGKPEGRRPLGRQDVREWIILKWRDREIKWGGMGSIDWLGIESSGRLL
jgi:hypothetical protein